MAGNLFQQQTGPGGKIITLSQNKLLMPFESENQAFTKVSSELSSQAKLMQKIPSSEQNLAKEFIQQVGDQQQQLVDYIVLLESQLQTERQLVNDLSQ